MTQAMSTRAWYEYCLSAGASFAKRNERKKEMLDDMDVCKIYDGYALPSSYEVL